MPFLNMALVKSPQNWARILFMVALGFAGIFLLAHLVTPNSVEKNPS